MSAPPDVVRLVRELSDSVTKQGVLSKFHGPNPSPAEGSPLKRKSVYSGSSPSSKKRDDRPGMFTPPPFDLLGSSQETADDVIEVAPLAWAESQGAYFFLLCFFYFCSYFLYKSSHYIELLGQLCMFFI